MHVSENLETDNDNTHERNHRAAGFAGNKDAEHNQHCDQGCLGRYESLQSEQFGKIGGMFFCRPAWWQMHKTAVAALFRCCAAMEKSFSMLGRIQGRLKLNFYELLFLTWYQSFATL